MMTFSIRQSPQLSEGNRGLDLAYEVGRWCYYNDEPCPYNRDEDVCEWYRGYTMALRENEKNR